MLRAFLVAAGLLIAGRAVAADEPIYAPEASWVHPLPIPVVAPATDGSPVQMLLLDGQVSLSRASGDYYQRRVYRILSPQGLSPSGLIAEDWDPAIDTLTIHHLHVIHDGKVTDVLADGRKFLVLRRENNLELAVLDGRMTATIQPDGLEVGDIVDFAFTWTSRDPALGGHSTAYTMLQHPGVAGRIHYRVLWDSSLPVNWRQTEGIGTPKVTKTAEGTELLLDMTKVVTPKPPINAPYRFQRLGALEISDFRDWSELSALFAPLYQKAETLKPNSALKAEIDKIAAASSDPKVRATAALRLVESRIRYVFIGMDDAGLVPAAADQTWARRFGDCKGKSVLLVAILRGLGLDAQPAIVSTQSGDGMDQRLPRVGLFNHVIVRLQIAGKTYWLDGTRQSDLKLDDLRIPNFHWALPIQSSGATLVRLDPPPLESPDIETIVKIDASKGIAPPAPTHVELVYRGEEAVAARQNLLSVPRGDFERGVREKFTKDFPWATIDKIDIVQDDALNQVRLVGDGLGKIDWLPGDGGTRIYHAINTTVWNNVSFKREPGPNSDAPYTVRYPMFTKFVETVVLPVDGDYNLVGQDVDAPLAEGDLRRHSRIDNGVLDIEISMRTKTPEFAFARAEGDAAALRALPRGDVFAIYRKRPDGVQQARATPLTGASVETDEMAAQRGDAAAQFRLGLNYLNGSGVPKDYAQAMTWFQKAAAQGQPQAMNSIASLYDNGLGVPKDIPQAMIWTRKAAERGDAVAQRVLGLAYQRGYGVPMDREQAIAWLTKAANQGDGFAVIQLAMLTGKKTVIQAKWRSPSPRLSSLPLRLGMVTDARLSINLDALAANHDALRRLASGAEVAPVVKADGYGLGSTAVARRLSAEGAKTFFVARISEGETLRTTLGPEAAIQVFDGCPPGSADRLIAAGLTPVLNSVEQIAEWRATAPATTPVALHIDTGMNRLGVSVDEAANVSDLPVELVISHLACASTPDHPLNMRQRDAFAEVRAMFPDARASLANSAGVCLGADYHFDLVRPGIALFGGGPFGAPDARFKAVATLEAPILQVREVAPGETIGYGAAFIAPRRMRIAILAAGYADGVLRAQSPSGYGWLDGQRRPLLGRISMDLIAIDVSEGAAPKPGDRVELLGANVMLDDSAAAAGTIGYEVLTRLSSRARGAST